MKYLTKYIPVEGEIKERDKCICLFGNSGNKFNNEFFDKVLDVNIVRELTKTPNQLKFSNAYPDSLHYANDFQKVKLFLCSRDIKVGDDVYEHGRLENIKMSGYIFGDHSIKTDLLFKVIGEISPDALSYVKEGMEYEEENIQYGLYHTSVGRVAVVKKESFEKMQPEYYIKYVQIKGPCGNFH